jgi:hypothetical protein
MSSDSAQTASETSPHLAPGLVRPLIATAAASGVAGLPSDPLLAGMVGAGQGLRAICLYLGLTEPALDDHLARLGLPRPHDRPLRKAGARGWSVADTIRLIVWRVRGIHPESIGPRFKRSPNAVRAKARRLGVPRPDRKSLRRVEPQALVDPLAGRGHGGAVAVYGMPEPLIGDAGRLSPLIANRPRTSAEPRDIIPKRRAKSSRSGAPYQIGAVGGPAADTPTTSDRITKQPELPLVSAWQTGGPGSSIGSVEPLRSRCRPDQPIPRAPDEVSLSGDLTWIGAVRKRQQNRAAVWAVGLLRFGGLDWRVIATRTGMSFGAARSFLSRAGVPIDRVRKKFSAVFDEECARETERRSGFEVASNTFFTKNDKEVTEYFWRHKSDRATVKRSRARRRAVGNLDPYQSETIEILTRADLDAECRGTPVFAEHQAIMGQKHIDRKTWHEEPARRHHTPLHRSGFSGRAGQPVFVADFGNGDATRGFADS